MPYKRKYIPKKKYVPKKKYTTRKKTNFKAMIPKNNVSVGLGFPKKMCAKLKYVETIGLTSSVGAVNWYQYIMNGLYDPNFTGTGHQPMYFDQYMAIYAHYTVVGCKVTVRFVATEGNTVGIKVALWQNDDTSVVPTNLEAMSEQSISRYCILTEGNAASKVMTLKWSAKKTFGGSVMANNSLLGTISNNPNENSVAVIGVQSVDGTTTSSVTCQVTMEFITVFSEIRDQAQS